MTMDRRQFISLAATTSVSSLLSNETRPLTVARKRILVLGGTNFLGPATVRALLNEGHDVTLFNRGVTNPRLFPRLEKLRGLRSPDPAAENLSALKGRSWDAIIDVWPSDPAIAESTARVLGSRTSHYLYVSSISAYARRILSSPGITEDAPLEPWNSAGRAYNRGKAESERRLQSTLGEALTIVRPGPIKGERDDTADLYAWLRRAMSGGQHIGPGDGTDHVQIVDVKDVGRFIALAINERLVGTYNLTGRVMSFRQFIDACRSAVRSDTDFVWMPLWFLHAHGLDPAPGSLGYFPFWHPEPTRRGLFQISSQKAFAAGWQTRPFQETARDYLEWFRGWAPEWKDELSVDVEARVLQTWTSRSRDKLSIQNASGLQLSVASENAQPMLRIVRPRHAVTDRSIEVLFPEHVTAVKHGGVAEQLYMFRTGQQGERPLWRRAGRVLEYQRDLPGDLHLLARATLDDDGVRFRYEFTNRSSVVYDMIIAVTDPRLTSDFYDPRLERTYVHHRDGFDLIASETPSRLTAPLDQWLPARYLASFTWPVPALRIERRSDGITYYNKSRAVDEPFIATLSTDSNWLVASFAREAGNVWTNPALTCQHVDPQVSLGPRRRVILERKILILRGSLDDALQRARQQRGSLK
jgi:nucleoside-diphosphate-sugar epimerase